MTTLIEKRIEKLELINYKCAILKINSNYMYILPQSVATSPLEGDEYIMLLAAVSNQANTIGLHNYVYTTCIIIIIYHKYYNYVPEYPYK